jgi:hypothetical protein
MSPASHPTSHAGAPQHLHVRAPTRCRCLPVGCSVAPLHTQPPQPTNQPPTTPTNHHTSTVVSEGAQLPTPRRQHPPRLAHSTHTRSCPGGPACRCLVPAGPTATCTAARHTRAHQQKRPQHSTACTLETPSCVCCVPLVLLLLAAAAAAAAGVGHRPSRSALLRTHPSCALHWGCSCRQAGQATMNRCAVCVRVCARACDGRRHVDDHETARM